MDDEEEIVRELRKLESMSDDLYLNDADATWGGSKRVGASKYEKRGGRGAPPDRSQGRFDPENLNNFDNWDLERQSSDSGKFDPRRGGIRGRSKPFDRTNDRRDLGANGAQKPGGRGKPYENSRREDFETMSNTFDIEGKLQRSMDKNPTDRNLDRSWSRESREGPLYGRQLAMDDPDLLKKSDDQSGYIMHRKDPRLTNKLIEMEVEPMKRGDPRLSQKADGVSMDMYRAPMKDPRVRDDLRLSSQDKNKEDDEMALRGNALGQSHPKSDSRAATKPEQPRGFQNRFMPVRSDPRQQQPLIDFNKPRAETIFEKISNNPALLANQIPGIASEEQRMTKESSDRSKRGPRSPSGSVSPGHGGKKDRNGSPGRKRERSPARNRSNRWERSPSPRARRDRSVSPRRRSGRKERSVSNDRRRSHDRRDWSSSPRRDRQRRERSPSPRRRRRSRSGSGDRSNSGHRTVSPPARGQRGGQPRYPPGPGGQSGYDMPPPGIYGDNYQPPPYGAPPAGMLEPWSLIPGIPFVNNQLPPKQWLMNGPPQYPPYQQQQYHYENYGYPPQPAYGEYPPPPPQVAPPPPHGMPPGWGGDRAMMYPDMSQPPPPSQPPILPPPPSQVPPPMPVPVQPPAPPKVDAKAEEAKKEAKEAAIKNEVLQQKQTLSKQREEYMRKSSMISRELKLLKDQEQTLREENCRDNDRILRENNKLQLEIQNKLKAINNVIDMLTGIIGDKKELEEKQRLKAEAKLKHPKTPPETPPKSSSDSSPETNKARLPEPPVPGVMDEPLPAPPVLAAPVVEDKKPVFNYVHYDPEMHWCRVCDVFPRTAKEFLNHLHSAEHREETQARKMVDMPWHKSVKAEEEAVYYKGAPTKRTPIRGLQFFISATAWYCKLCDTWIGDLHCASLHLKSKTHTENYVSFTEQSPHWETDWLADREKAYEHKAEERRQQAVVEPVPVEASPSSLHDDKSKRSKKKKDRKGKDDKDGKKKKRRKKKKKAKDSSGSESSSSSSSEESSDEESEAEDDKGKSIRVAMRNKMKAFEDELKEMPTGGYMRPSSGWQSVEVKEEERLAREMQEKQLLEMERREKYLKAKAEEQFEREQAERERYELQLIQEQQSKFRKVPAKEDKMLSEWMGPNKELPEGERQILTSIRDRVKMRQEAEKDSRKREDRDRYYDNRYHEEGRRRRRGESPDGRPGKRGRSRSPEERRYEKVRGGEREGRYKRSPLRSKPDGSRFQEVRSDSVEKVDRKHSSKRLGTSEQDEAESKFERQAAEAAARLKKKDKKPVVAAIPKSKLPFIGRMPIMKHLAKKKPGEEEPPPESKEKLPEVGLVLIGPTLPPHLKPPGLVIPEELGGGAGAVVQDMDIDDEDSNAGDAPVVEEQVSAPVYVEPTPEEPPPAAYVAEVATESPAAPDAEPHEEVVEEGTVTKEEAPKKPLNDIPLPKDFQEALNILFPGQTKPGEAAPKEATPPAEAQPAESQWTEQMSQPPPHAMGYGPMMGMPPGMPPGMHPMFSGMMPGINGPPNFQVPPPNMMNPDMMSQPPPFVAAKKEERVRKKAHKVDSDDSSDDDDDEDSDRFKSELSADDLAMLGIDAGDMAAQSFRADVF